LTRGTRPPCGRPGRPPSAWPRPPRGPRRRGSRPRRPGRAGARAAGRLREGAAERVEVPSLALDRRGRRAPLARTTAQSFVEVSPSTVIRLRLVPPPRRAPVAGGGLDAASVVRKPASWPCSGDHARALAIPPTTQVEPPTGNSTATSFGLVSVVMMARPRRPRRGGRGAGPPPRCPHDPLHGKAHADDTGRGHEHSSTGQPTAWARSPPSRGRPRAPPRRWRPFAQPALTTIARARPPPSAAGRGPPAPLHEVGGKDAGGGAGAVGHHEREVEAVGLDARATAAARKPSGAVTPCSRCGLLTSAASRHAGLAASPRPP